MLTNALIYLCAAVIAVPVAKRLGLGSVLGYLLAGVAIGPYVLHLVGDQTEVMHFAEFGVVMMLFLIGLELQPSRLWGMRRPILGLGGMQVALTTAAIVAALLLTGLHWKTSVAIGLALALSSTAIALQLLTERGLLKTGAGDSTFAVLLFQDIAVIPILAMLPLLATTGATSAAGDHHSMIHNLPVWGQFGVNLAIVAAIVLGGRFLSTPVFRFIAETRLHEVFTAFALLIVVAIAALMKLVGLSPALGTFLAGVVLAESEFRHELEVDIEPFKGLLLGLFFITIGASIDFSLLIEQPVLIGLAVVGLMAVKAAVLAFLARLFGMGLEQGLLFTLVLAQGGEFAFVIVAAGWQFGVFGRDLGNLLTVIVALSMLISPLLMVVYERIKGSPKQRADYQDDQTIEATCQIIIAGYGRFGQIIGRLLHAQNYELTILDHSPSQVETVRRFGSKVYYGDASRRELLAAAGADDAKLLIIAVDDADKTLDIIDTAKKHFPHLKILARAIDRRHTYKLMEVGVDGIHRETFHSALRMGVDALKLMGREPAAAERAGELFNQHDQQNLEYLASLWGDDKSYGVAVRQRLEDLQRVLQADQASRQPPQTNNSSETENESAAPPER